MKEFKYDVAFSFLYEDLQLVSDVYELLKDRLKIFFFVDRQDELVGKDGEEEFSEVFGHESRVVVIFYREKWGIKGFTRTEKNAIKNRAFSGEDYYNFMLFVNLEDKNPEISWIPKTNIYFNFKQYGANGLASAIENMVIQNGGIVHEESSIELAARIERRRDAEQKRKKFLESEEGVSVAYNEFKHLCEIIKNKMESISNNSSIFKSQFEFINEHFKIECNTLVLYCHWFLRARNTLHGSNLTISIINNPPWYSNNKQKELFKKYYFFDRNISEQNGWLEKEDDKKFYSSQQLAEQVTKLFITKISEEITKREKSFD